MPRNPHTSLVGRKRKSGDERIEIGSLAIAQHPELRSLVGGCLMAWPFVELELAIILGQLLGTKNDSVMAVFEATRRSASQRDAISEAGIFALDRENRDILSAVLNIVKSIESERNALGHGCFGHSDLLPDAMIWQGTVDYLSHRRSVSLREETEWNKDRHEAIIATLFVYTRSDLETILSEIDKLGHFLHLFLNYLKSISHGDVELSSRLRRQLCDQPHMARELDRVRHGKI
jgi:hypothetical protein